MIQDFQALIEQISSKSKTHIISEAGTFAKELERITTK